MNLILEAGSSEFGGSIGVGCRSSTVRFAWSNSATSSSFGKVCVMSASSALKIPPKGLYCCFGADSIAESSFSLPIAFLVDAFGVNAITLCFTLRSTLTNLPLWTDFVSVRGSRALTCKALRCDSLMHITREMFVCDVIETECLAGLLDCRLSALV